jgi:class 3 adenylate cyclase
VIGLLECSGDEEYPLEEDDIGRPAVRRNLAQRVVVNELADVLLDRVTKTIEAILAPELRRQSCREYYPGKVWVVGLAQVGGNELKQRLVAILAADAAGYSRLMATDERATVSALDAARAVFRTSIEVSQGRVVDMAGDSVLAVFDSATAAVTAALVIQAELHGQAIARPGNRRMWFRIGVHLGDVFEKLDGTVYGDGVNMAARLQALAEPGGVTVSDAVHGAVRGRVEAVFADLGPQQVKNIAMPVHAFSCAPAGAAAVASLRRAFRARQVNAELRAMLRSMFPLLRLPEKGECWGIDGYRFCREELRLGQRFFCGKHRYHWIAYFLALVGTCGALLGIALKLAPVARTPAAAAPRPPVACPFSFSRATYDARSRLLFLEATGAGPIKPDSVFFSARPKGDASEICLGGAISSGQSRLTYSKYCDVDGETRAYLSYRDETGQVCAQEMDISYRGQKATVPTNQPGSQQ